MANSPSIASHAETPRVEAARNCGSPAVPSVGTGHVAETWPAWASGTAEGALDSRRAHLGVLGGRAAYPALQLGLGGAPFSPRLPGPRQGLRAQLLGFHRAQPAPSGRAASPLGVPA